MLPMATVASFMVRASDVLATIEPPKTFVADLILGTAVLQAIVTSTRRDEFTSSRATWSAGDPWRRTGLASLGTFLVVVCASTATPIAPRSVTRWNLVSPSVTSSAPSTAGALRTAFNPIPATAPELGRGLAGGWDGYRCDPPPNDLTRQLGQAVFLRLTRSTTLPLTASGTVSASSLRRIAPMPAR